MTEMSKLIYIILKNHDKLEFTIPCIESLKKTSYKNKKILIIDDNSKHVPILECKKLGVELIHLKKYSDFCKCFNIGIKHALKNGADYIFIVNNDTRNFSVNYFETAIKAFDNPKVGMVGTKCLNYDGTLQWGREPHIIFNIPMNVPTCGYILRSDMLDDIGGFDLSLYRYWEDIDLIMRLRAAGWQTIFVPSVSFEHYGSGTSGKMYHIKNFYKIRNMIWFFKKYGINKKIIINVRYAGSYLVSSFLSIRKLECNKLNAFYSFVKGVFIGIFTPWLINHEI